MIESQIKPLVERRAAQHVQDEFRAMYESVTNPDIIQANRRIAERKERLEAKIADTGL